MSNGFLALRCFHLCIKNKARAVLFSDLFNVIVLFFLLIIARGVPTTISILGVSRITRLLGR
jgi:hypothetical protein